MVDFRDCCDKSDLVYGRNCGKQKINGVYHGPTVQYNHKFSYEPGTYKYDAFNDMDDWYLAQNARFVPTSFKNERVQIASSPYDVCIRSHDAMCFGTGVTFLAAPYLFYKGLRGLFKR